MERIKKQPSLILCSDFHLREETPVCYTGDYQKEQWNCIGFISDLQKEYDCPVVHAGDLFDKWKPSPWLLTMTIRHLPKRFYSIAGQHDLPQHSFHLIEKSGINTLAEAEKIVFLPRVHWGDKPEDFHYQQDAGVEDWLGIKDKKILVWHKMVWQNKKPYPTCVDPPASSILKKYPQFSLILCGDNHRTFVEEYEGRLLVNPGSLMRMDADQIDHKPSIFLWYSDNSVKQIFLPIEEGVVTRTHLVEKEERNERLEAFVTKLNDDYKTTVSFEDNLTQFFNANEVDPETKQIIYNVIE
jgi:DNA repair exonuclease SbcCD nuclease subunit